MQKDMEEFDLKFEFVSNFEEGKGKLFATRCCSIFYELKGKTLLIKGRYLDYNWDKDFKETVNLLCETVREGEIQPETHHSLLNCSLERKTLLNSAHIAVVNKTLQL